MSEYIERGALIELAKHQWCESCREAGADGNGIGCRACVVAYVIEEIEDAPAADVVEVKHGDWWGIGNMLMCTVCHKEFYEPTNYCPNCGAKMDGE